MERLNVFGGSGYIGSAFCSRFAKIADDAESRADAVKNGCIINARNDYVPKTNNILYFISTTDNYNVHTDPFLDVNTNLITLLTVLNNIQDKENAVFNFISSWFVYGDTDLPATEESYCNPKGFYSITKRAAEQLLISYCETFGIKYRILRLGNVVGGNSTFSKKKNALEFMINQLKNNETVKLYEGGFLFRDFIHIDDCVDAINLVITKGELNQIYNIGNGEKVTLRRYVVRAHTMLKSTSEIESIDTPRFHKNVQVESMYMDNSKIKRLGYVPKYIGDNLIQKIIEDKYGS